MTITDRIKTLTQIESNIHNEIYAATAPYTQELREVQLSQLWDGQRSDGEDIRPSYTEDDYFKTKESAQRYRDWKQRITPNSNRNSDAPNLYINGRFYGDIDVVADIDGISTIARTVYASEIMGRYGAGTFGLNPDRARDVFAEKIIPDLRKNIKAML